MLDRSLDIQSSIELISPAKLNLSLLIYGKRPDGFHDLHSVMAALNFGDRLMMSISQASGIYLDIAGAGNSVPNGPENLIWRAAQLLADHVGMEPAIKIRVDKRIPAGGGMGGASSNAATTLIGLNQLWKLNLPNKELASLAACLGSDVSFFIYTPLAQCSGRGEIVSPLIGKVNRKVLLILPGIHVSTADVYKNYIFDPYLVEEQRKKVDEFIAQNDFDALFENGFNSLTSVTMKLVPELDCLRDTIENLTGTQVFMSGSGSTLYICGKSTEELERMVDKICAVIGQRCKFVITDFL